MADQDFFETVLERSTTERPTFRQAPAGDYLVTVRSVAATSSKKGTQGLKFTFTMREPMHSEDMTGVDLSRCRLEDTQWVTEKTLPYLQERLERISPETVGKSVREAMDYLPGNEVVLSISHITHNDKGEAFNTPILAVDRYYSVDYYMSKKRAA